MKKIYFITGNKEKVMILKNVFGNSGFEIIQNNTECPEIQHEDICEVAKFSAKFAAEKLRKPVIKNDCGLFIKVFNGFPGFAAKFAEKWLKADGFLKLMEGQKNRKIKYVDATAYCEPGKKPIVFVTETEGTMSKKKSGDHGWEMDTIFIVKGCDKTMAHYPDEKRINLLNGGHYRKLLKYLKARRNKK